MDLSQNPKPKPKPKLAFRSPKNLTGAKHAGPGRSRLAIQRHQQSFGVGWAFFLAAFFGSNGSNSIFGANVVNKSGPEFTKLKKLKNPKIQKLKNSKTQVQK